MIKSHPNEQLLRQFVAGELPPAMALAVSAHVDMCRLCQRQVAQLEQQQAQFLIRETAPTVDTITMDPGLEQMLSQILESPEPIHSVKPETQVEHVSWKQHKFILPRALQRQIEKPAEWSQLGKLWRSRLLEDESWRTGFYYIEKGGQIPEHTHKGREITLVLHGSFVDDALYQEGDFIYRDSRHVHKPGAQTDEDCLCFTAVEAPLHFTTGAARLLNPIGSLLY